MLAPISFCNWINFLSPTIRFSLPTPRLGGPESNTGACVTQSHNIHDHSDSYTQAVLILRVSRAMKMMLLNAADSEQHGQFPSCIIRGFVLNETSQLRHVKRGIVSQGNVTSWGTDRLDAYISHWLLSLDESILTTDKYLNSEFLVIETQIMKRGGQLCITEITWTHWITLYFDRILHLMPALTVEYTIPVLPWYGQ